MKKQLLLLCSILLIFSCSAVFAQNKNRLQYSKRFDSYYRKGPLKFALEPGPTFQWGDVRKKRLSYGIGFSGNYKTNAALDLVVGLRYFNLKSNDNSISTSTGFYQLNGLGRLYLRYDRVRTNLDRRKPPKFWKLFLSSGLNISRYSASASSGEKAAGFRLSVPVGIGMPFRISDRFQIIPEIQFYYTLSEKIDALALGTPNDRFLVASIGLEFNPSGKRKHPKTVKLDETEGEGGDGGGSGGDGDGGDDLEDGGEDMGDEMEDDGSDDTPEVPVEETPEEEEEESEDDDSDDSDEEDTDSEDEEGDDEDEDGDWEDDGDK